MPAAALARRLQPIAAMTLGFAIATSGWFVMGAVPTIEAPFAGVAIFALGEAIQAPRYYEYVADLAPRDQVGTYMGIAFLPIAIGTFGAGLMAGRLVEAYKDAAAAVAHVVRARRHRRRHDHPDGRIRSLPRAARSRRRRGGLTPSFTRQRISAHAEIDR